MKKKMLTRLISLVLALVLVVNLVPFVNAAESATDYVEITSNEAPLRAGAGKDHREIVTLHRGDCLIIRGYSVNKHGNQWYKVEYGDDVAYLYAPHAKPHQHSYSPVADGLNACKCGAYTIDRNSPMMQTNAAAATAGTLVSAGAMAAAGDLYVAGTAIAAAMTVAFPYIAIVAVGGMLIYMGVNSTGTQVRDVTKIRTIEDVRALMNASDGINVYFAAAFSNGPTPTLMLTSAGMDIDEATNYLRKCVRDPLAAMVYSATGASMANIFTFTDKLAATLCSKFMSLEKGYVYGNSSGNLFQYEHDGTYRSYKIYFNHFHLHKQNGIFSLTKVRDIHILFGDPLDRSAFV